MLPLIGAFKLAKGLLILAVALGVLHLVRGDPADTLAHWASELHIDPEGRHFTRAVDRILSLDARRLKARHGFAGARRAWGIWGAISGPPILAGERVEARTVVPEDLRLRLSAHAFERDELVDGLGEQSVGVRVVGRDDDVVVTDRLHHLPEHPLVGVGGDVALPVEVLAREPADLHLGAGAELLPRLVH